MRSWRSRSPAETREVGSGLLAELLPDRALLLTGDLAAGKTVLAQGVAAALGIDPAEVQSPTFTLVREHQGPGGRLLHLDLYRLEPAEAAGLGLEELLAAPAIKVVEWAERLPLQVPGALRLHLRRQGGGEERAIVEVVGSAAEGTA
ncbi:MAG TPA: tRNA (adenosine(37)-N6)-threonylcarbamoyltransferase complex ATPase subunit type 1 TsaE [Thermoanaerobaculia bacterium]|jgi:tRNA threonylcarbamoyladenosine biosynthesis protein TsaE|nr:tRNA (adenosine(37)-N6)-threonylcarbamoyltransferase complex ATPase subunit type 1 TsaE [Thermoanaerobaculia bacterium]